MKETAQANLNVVGVPALLLEVVDREDPVEVGGEICYEIRVLNQGSATSSNVQILATVPEGLTEFRSWSWRAASAASSSAAQKANQPISFQ